MRRLITALAVAGAYLANIPPKEFGENIADWLTLATSLWGGH